MQPVVLEKTAQKNKGDATSSLDFAALFREYHPRVYNYLRYRVNLPEDAEDLISAIFEKAYTHREKFDPAKGAFSTWLFRIAHNTLANYYRTRQRRSVWETDTELPQHLVAGEALPEAQMLQQEAVAQLLRGLSNLAERDQEVISLKFAGPGGNGNNGNGNGNGKNKDKGKGVSGRANDNAEGGNGNGNGKGKGKDKGNNGKGKGKGKNK